MAPIRGRRHRGQGLIMLPCSSIESTARSRRILEEVGEEVVGPCPRGRSGFKPVDKFLASGSGSKPLKLLADVAHKSLISHKQKPPRPNPKNPKQISRNQNAPHIAPLPKPKRGRPQKGSQMVPPPEPIIQNSPQMVNPPTNPSVVVSPNPNYEVPAAPVSHIQNASFLSRLPRFGSNSNMISEHLRFFYKDGPYVPMPDGREEIQLQMTSPYPSSTLSVECDMCGKKFRSHDAMWGHKASHYRAMRKALKSSPQPPFPSLNSANPNESAETSSVCLELGLSLGNGATRGNGPHRVVPGGVPPITREKVRFSELLNELTYKHPEGGENNPNPFAVQLLSDEDLELKLGV